jgi:hypothetical protein
VRLAKAAVNLAFAEEQEKLAEERRKIKVRIACIACDCRSPDLCARTMDGATPCLDIYL